MIKRLALIFLGVLLLVVIANASANKNVFFEGYDTVLGIEVKFVFRNDKFYMDSQEMQVLRHKNMPM